MSHDDINYLINQHIAVKLLKSTNAPLTISFLYYAFKENNQRVVKEGELVDLLDGYLFSVRQQDEKLYPKTAKSYMADWTESGFLHKKYEHSSDEPVFQLTSSVEVVFTWIQSLDVREFVGTESRLLQIFQLLENITEKSTTNATERIALLKKQKQAIQEEIDQLNAEPEPDSLDDTQIKERFYELEDITYNLLADFRKIEENFRELDKETRQQQLKASYAKGEVVEGVLDAKDSLWKTDQGRSFTAFWEFLMSQSRQDKLDDLVKEVLALPQIQQLEKKSKLNRFKIELITAGDQVNRVNHLLVDHLRQFLSNYVQSDRKLIIEKIEAIEKEALEVKGNILHHQPFFALDENPAIDFTFMRPLFTPPEKVVLDNTPIEEGKAEANTDLLFEQTYIDPQELRRNIRQMLKRQKQVTLKEITTEFPISKGLQEVLTYYNIATKEQKASIQEDVIEKIIIRNERNENSTQPTFIEVPQVVFTA